MVARDFMAAWEAADSTVELAAFMAASTSMVGRAAFMAADSTLEGSLWEEAAAEQGTAASPICTMVSVSALAMVAIGPTDGTMDATAGGGVTG